VSQYTRVTDGQTDGQTDRQTKFSSQYRVCITCSAVKIGQRGFGLGHVTFCSKFRTTPNISGTAEGTNLKFCMQSDGKGY